MPGTPNPLQEMTNVVRHDIGQVERPNESYADTVLPVFKKVLEARRSIRVFDGKPIPEEVMRDCLKDATLAPSSSNLQTYELYWVRNPEKKAKVAEACLNQPAATTAGEIIVVVARRDLWKVNLNKLVDIMTHGGKKELPGPLRTYYKKLIPMLMRNDPVGLNNLFRQGIYSFRGLKEPFMRTPVNTGDHRIYAHIQSSLAGQTLLLSLAAHGYDSCPIGGMDINRISKILKLPSQAEITFVAAAGRGKPEGLYGRRIRLPDEDLIKEVC